MPVTDSSLWKLHAAFTNLSCLEDVDDGFVAVFRKVPGSKNTSYPLRLLEDNVLLTVIPHVQSPLSLLPRIDRWMVLVNSSLLHDVQKAPSNVLSLTAAVNEVSYAVLCRSGVKVENLYFWSRPLLSSFLSFLDQRSLTMKSPRRLFIWPIL